MIGKKYQLDYEPTICISDISDQLPLVININNMYPYKLPKTKIETRKLDNNKMATLNNRIQSVDWSTKVRDMDANESFNNLHSYISNQLNDIAPIKTFAINDKKTNQKQMAHQWPVEMYGQAEKAVQKDITN